MFCDETKLTLGGQTVNVRRLTIGEIRKANLDFGGAGVPFDEKLDEIVKTHVATAEGKPLDIDTLSLPQMRQVVNALVGVPEDSPLSDFIGLLS